MVYFKRRSSSILRGLNVLVSHVRAATYVLVIVSVYLVTWMPFFIFCIYKSFFSLETVVTIQNVETFGENLSQLKKCLTIALQDKTCDIEVDYMLEMDVVIKHIFESEQTKTIFRLLGLYLALLNSLANPVFYAFWYPEFRKYLMNIFKWIKLNLYCKDASK